MLRRVHEQRPKGNDSATQAHRIVATSPKNGAPDSSKNRPAPIPKGPSEPSACPRHAQPRQPAEGPRKAGPSRNAVPESARATEAFARFGSSGRGSDHELPG